MNNSLACTTLDGFSRDNWLLSYVSDISRNLAVTLNSILSEADVILIDSNAEANAGYCEGNCLCNYYPVFRVQYRGIYGNEYYKESNFDGM